MRPLGEALAARGHTVVAPLLPGHGTRVEEMLGLGWRDWFAAVVEAWDQLGRSTTRRVAAGLSMGALLVLHLARERREEVKALALLAPVLQLRNQRRIEAATWILRVPRLPRALEIVAKGGGPAARPAYDRVPLGALASLVDLQRTVRAELAAIDAPALVVEGGADMTVAASAGAAVERGLGSAVKRRVVFPASGHVLTEDVDARDVVDAVARFFAETLGRGSPAPPFAP